METLRAGIKYPSPFWNLKKNYITRLENPYIIRTQSNECFCYMVYIKFNYNTNIYKVNSKNQQKYLQSTVDIGERRKNAERIKRKIT